MTDESPFSDEDQKRLDELLAEIERKAPEMEAMLEAMLREDEGKLDKLLRELESSNSLDSLLAETIKQDEEKVKKLFAELESHDFDAMLRDIGVDFDTPAIPQLDPDPYVDPAPNAMAADVAQWMAETVRADWRLSHHRVVSHIIDHFGRKFLYRNGHGNFAIMPGVLKAFWPMTPDVVWAHQGHYWRLRQDSDPPRRRRVKE